MVASPSSHPFIDWDFSWNKPSSYWGTFIYGNPHLGGWQLLGSSEGSKLKQLGTNGWKSLCLWMIIFGWNKQLWMIKQLWMKTSSKKTSSFLLSLRRVSKWTLMGDLRSSKGPGCWGMMQRNTDPILRMPIPINHLLPFLLIFHR